MADPNRSERHQWSCSARVRRRGVAGLITAVGAFWAFILFPLATAPATHADLFDAVVDAVGEPAAGWLPVLDPGSLDLVGGDAAATSDPAEALAAFSYG